MTCRRVRGRETTNTSESRRRYLLLFTLGTNRSTVEGNSLAPFQRNSERHSSCDSEVLENKTSRSPSTSIYLFFFFSLSLFFFFFSLPARLTDRFSRTQRIQMLVKSRDTLPLSPVFRSSSLTLLVYICSSKREARTFRNYLRELRR